MLLLGKFPPQFTCDDMAQICTPAFYHGRHPVLKLKQTKADNRKTSPIKSTLKIQ